MGPLSCGCAAQERCDQDLIIHWYTKEEGWRGSEGRGCGSEGKERDKSLSINESVVLLLDLSDCTATGGGGKGLQQGGHKPLTLFDILSALPPLDRKLINFFSYA